MGGVWNRVARKLLIDVNGNFEIEGQEKHVFLEAGNLELFSSYLLGIRGLLNNACVNMSLKIFHNPVLKEEKRLTILP